VSTTNIDIEMFSKYLLISNFIQDIYLVGSFVSIKDKAFYII